LQPFSTDAAATVPTFIWREFTMRKKSDRRNFLRGGAAGLAAASALAVPAAAGAQRMRPTKRVIRRPGETGPPRLPFSSGIQFGRLLFVSGQGAHNPKTGKVEDVPFPEQVRQCLENVKTVLEAAGSSLDRVLKCTVFLNDIKDYTPMNEVYAKFFTKDPPARSTVAVREIPGNSPVEIECIAYVDRMTQDT
jgi:2-iminobutanoate/2-iminopropanoate deaminase